MRIRSRSLEPAVGMEMTPFIDVVFLLLIFFLVATTFQRAERQLQIALPIAAAAGPLSSALREIVINVNAQGQLFVSSRPVSTDELRALVEQAVSGNANQKVTVRGDRHAAYGHIVKALDVCKAAGVQEPYLDTVLE